MSGWFVLLLCFIAIPVVNANSVDSDQTLRSAASGLGLHCLPMSHLLDARLKWVLQRLYVMNPGWKQFVFALLLDTGLKIYVVLSRHT